MKRSWGEPGTGPGQFHIPHGIAVAADGRVFVCDRESDRIQIFSPDGEYLTEWTDTQRPTHLVFYEAGRAYVSELIESVERVKKSGGSLEEAQRTVTPATLRTLDRSGFGGYVATAESRFRLRPPGSDIWDQISSSVKGNVAAVWSALAG